MNKAIAMKWVKALRSGKYKQGKEQLRTVEGEYCCLGVLCDITKEQTRGKWDEMGRFSRLTQGDGVVLPYFVREVTGMQSDDGRLPGEVANKLKNYDLAALNDGGGYGFKRIANLIEKYWKVL
jgi:hypothetical protein